MRYYADLHLHSHYSRATAKSCDLKHLGLWARYKGLSALGTGDFTHPGWREELKQNLAPAEPGCFRLLPELEADIERSLPGPCRGPMRFLLSAEISTIYKKTGRTRKVHHVVFAPDFESVERLVKQLSRIGNLASDGRPILGLDSRDLLEMVLGSGEGCFLVPAHIWTPWFSALGSASGFDSIDECYADLAEHIFAVETGLSSDPAMNWRVSRLDRFRMVSNSDAHSPEMLGREACAFDTELDYFSIRRALETGRGYLGTVEFYPEEGKYHLDGHRKCGVRLTPGQTREQNGCCPVCGKPVTVGVMNRVEELADRSESDPPPDTAGRVWSLVPLPEILGELATVGRKSKTVAESYQRLIARLGPELSILTEAPLEEINKEGSSLLGEAISRLRQARVIREAGYDGEYGTIRLFQPDELGSITRGGWLFGTPSEPSPAGGRGQGEGGRPLKPSPAGGRGQGEGGPVFHSLSGLDPEQRKAAEAVDGPVLIAAGPGSGKTRTLTCRIAHLVSDCGAAAEQCLAVTFSRRAAGEMRERLERLIPDRIGSIPVLTFHALGLSILREHAAAAGLAPGFCVAGEQERVALLAEAMHIKERKARGIVERISRLGRAESGTPDPELAEAEACYRRALRAKNLVDYDDLVALAARLLQTDPALCTHYRKHYRWISVDEFQDIDAQQYKLIKLLAPSGSNLCAIGDPDQAIYGFRGSDAGFFRRFTEDYPGARVFSLTRNYRCCRPIAEASAQVMARRRAETTPIEAVLDSSCKIEIHQAPTEAAEAEFVVKSLEQMIGGHSFFSVDSGRAGGRGPMNLGFSDFAVLYRTDAQAEAICTALARSGIPYQKRSHERLNELPAVRAILGCLLLGETGESLRDRLQTAARKAAIESGPDDAVSPERIEAALELLAPLADACGGDAERFQSELALGSEVDTWDPRADRVSLLTLHAAKGLEFRVVFILGCEQGILPLTWPGDEGPALEEERRLFYVGMTRASDLLLLCRAARRRWRGKIKSLPPSIFLQDIEEKLIERRESDLGSRSKRDSGRQLDLF